MTRQRDPIDSVAEGLAQCLILSVINSASKRGDIERYAISLKTWATAHEPGAQRVMFIVAGLVEEWLRTNPDNT